MVLHVGQPTVKQVKVQVFDGRFLLRCKAFYLGALHIGIVERQDKSSVPLGIGRGAGVVGELLAGTE